MKIALIELQNETLIFILSVGISILINYKILISISLYLYIYICIYVSNISSINMFLLISVIPALLTLFSLNETFLLIWNTTLPVATGVWRISFKLFKISILVVCSKVRVCISRAFTRISPLLFNYGCTHPRSVVCCRQYLRAITNELLDAQQGTSNIPPRRFYNVID